MLKLFSSLIKNVFYAIFNTDCCICGCKNTCGKDCAKTGEILCESCVGELEFCTNNQHKIFDGVIINSIFNYNDFAKKVIKELKFKYKRGVSITLARLLAEHFSDDKEYIVIPTPAHKARIRKYGFNHVESICREFCKIKGFKMDKKMLFKNRETLIQHFLNQEQRFKNVEDSFKINIKNYKGENLLIIDDITTTGATLQEIIKTFKKEGVDKITCLTVFK